MADADPTTDRTAPDEQGETVPAPVDETLVEEVSIDGMCGVY